jgi:hypothetical protein
MNKCFEENNFLDAVGECSTTPIAKPGKPPGEENSLKPLTLCNVLASTSEPLSDDT